MFIPLQNASLRVFCCLACSVEAIDICIWDFFLGSSWLSSIAQCLEVLFVATRRKLEEKMKFP